jgi:hypothetical protein
MIAIVVTTTAAAVVTKDGVGGYSDSHEILELMIAIAHV